METPRQLILSNGLLWVFLESENVHLFSRGDWLLSYQVPPELSMNHQPKVLDQGDSATITHSDMLTRILSLKRNILKDHSLLSGQYRFNPVFQNSFHFRGNFVPPIRSPIISLENNEYMRQGYPKIKVIEEQNEFSVLCALPKSRDTTSECITFDKWCMTKPKVVTQDKSFCSLYQNSLRSLYKLRLLTSEGPIRAAGFPYFPSLFGRDFSISALGEIYIDPLEVQREAEVHLSHIGEKKSYFSGEQVGRAPHEFPFDNESLSNRYEEFPSWFSNFANPLLLITIFRLGRIQNNFSLIEGYSREILSLWEHLLSLDVDNDGLIEYKHKPGQLLIHQTWRDGGDHIQYPEGGTVNQPIAPLHDQLCMIGAMKEILLYQQFTGNSPIQTETAELSEQIEKLQNIVEQAYWMPSLDAYALALDGENQQVRVVNSDVCFGYYYEIFSESNARKQYKTMIDRDRLLDSIGLRTVSKEHPLYSAISYQRGGVWPWQLALTIAGIQKYRLEAEPFMRCFHTLSKETSIAEVYRADEDLPTLGSGCIEQRWSSAVPWLFLIEGILGQEFNYSNETPFTNLKTLQKGFQQMCVENLPLKGKQFKIGVNEKGEIEIADWAPTYFEY